MYDVVISYHSEIEDIARKLYDFLRAEELDVFFAPEFQQEMVSEKLHAKLYDVYKNQSYLKLLLISPKYDQSEWTQLEKRMALESVKHDAKRLVIVNYIGGELTGELSPLVYIDGKKYTEDQIAAFVKERIQSQRGESGRGQSDYQSSAQGKEQGEATHVTNMINNGISFGNNATIGNINIRK